MFNIFNRVDKIMHKATKQFRKTLDAMERANDLLSKQIEDSQIAIGEYQNKISEEVDKEILAKQMIKSNEKMKIKLEDLFR